MVAAEPLRERRWELLILALHRCGRRGEALQTYQRARETLVEQLGIEPGPGLRELELAVLGGDPPAASTQGRPSARRLPDAQSRVALPQPTTSFHGRVGDVETISELMATRRMVTLVGPGGIGKTRLAVEVAHRLADDFPDGVYFCDLAAVDAEAVPRRLATTVGARQHEGTDPTTALLEALAHDHALLLLDNCEHVREAAAQLTDQLLRCCPQVVVLATSRERLGTRTERAVFLDQLDIDAACALFRERAQEAAPQLPAGTESPVIAELCTALDGLPLAIELAAARAAVLTAAELLAMLDARLRLLRSTDSQTHHRHSTLAATVQWSYDLLEPEQRMVFDHLSVFRGSFDLAAVVAVCPPLGDDGQRHALPTLDAIEALHAKSLLLVDLSGPRARYRLLETMRHYAAERLAERGEDRTAQERHLEHYAALCRRAQVAYEGPACVNGEAAFRQEWDNIRVAYRSARQRGDRQRLLDLVEAPFWFAYFGLVFEVGEWAETVLADGWEDPRLYGVASAFAHLSGEHLRAIELAEAGIALAPHRTHADTHLCHWGAGVAATHAGRIEAVEAYEDAQEAAALAAGSRFSYAVYHSGRTIWAAAVHPEQAPRFGASGLAAAEAIDNPAARAAALLYAGAGERAAGHRDVALAHYRAALEDCRVAGNRNIEALTVAWLAAQTGLDERTSTYRDALSWLRDEREWMGLWICLESLAAHWAQSDPEGAAIILGHLEQHHIGHAGVAARRRRALDTINGSDLAGALERGARMNRAHLIDVVLERLAATEGQPTGN
ncbi:MAG: BTAD domain-containing putative transcriptional regulator, partial [Vicinamibacterales bacterium]